MVEHSVSRALETCSRVLLVTGYRGKELEELFAGRDRVECVRNDEFRCGMFSSIQTGAAYVEAPLFFIALADMPELPTELYRILLEEMGIGNPAQLGCLEGKAPEMVRPLYRGEPGHPVLCRRHVADTILAEPPASNMQNVMRRHRLLEIDSPRPGCVYDIDGPEDLE